MHCKLLLSKYLEIGPVQMLVIKCVSTTILECLIILLPLIVRRLLIDPAALEHVPDLKFLCAVLQI
jgi:hypothetical protein